MSLVIVANIGRAVEANRAVDINKDPVSDGWRKPVDEFIMRPVVSSGAHGPTRFIMRPEFIMDPAKAQKDPCKLSLTS